MKKIMLSMLSITLMMLITILFTIPSNNVVAAPKTLKLSTKTINDPVIVQGDTYDVVASFDGLSDGLTVNWKTVWSKNNNPTIEVAKWDLILTISEDTYTCTIYYAGGYDRIKLIATCNEYPELQAICYLDCFADSPNYDNHYMNSIGEIIIYPNYTWNDIFKQFRLNDVNNYIFYDGTIAPDEVRNANVQYISVLEGCNEINLNNSEYTLDSLVYDFIIDINRCEFEEFGEYRWDNWDDVDREFDEIGDLYILFSLDLYYNDIYIGTVDEIEVFLDNFDWIFDNLSGIPGGE